VVLIAMTFFAITSIATPSIAITSLGAAPFNSTARKGHP